jgi:hypothetical protein
MTIARTPARVGIIEQLVGFNDELCYAMFADAELGRMLGRFGPSVDDRYSTDVFVGNPQAPRIHVTVSALRLYQETHRAFAFAAYLIASYEAASGYYEAAVQLLGACGSATVVGGKGDAIEHRFAAMLRASGFAPANDNDIRTLTYIRHRRNHLVHLGDGARQVYVDFASQHGPVLNQHWGATRDVVDFTVPAISQLVEPETIALIKMLRIAIERLDSVVAQSVDEAKATRYVAARIRKPLDRPNSDVLRGRAGQLRSAMTAEFGITVSADAAESAMVDAV